MKNNIALKTAFLVLGIVIGAGFASGAEIVTFFLDYGSFLPFLIILSGLLIFYIIYIFIRVGRVLKPKSITDITKVVFGKYYRIIDTIAMISLFIGVFAMLAGADALAIDVFTDYNFPYLSIVLSLLVVIIVMGGLKSLLKVDSYIVPFMVSLVIIVPITFLLVGEFGVVTFNTSPNLFYIGQGVFSSMLYVCMNMFTVGIIVSELGPIVKNAVAVKSAIFSSICLVICVGVVLLAVMNSSNIIASSSMPMVLIAYSLGDFMGGVYSVVVLFGILTTLIASSFALDNWLKQFIKDKVLSISIIITLAFIVSRLGFSNIVQIFYPIEGMLGFIFIFGVIIFYYRNRKRIDKLE